MKYLFTTLASLLLALIPLRGQNPSGNEPDSDMPDRTVVFAQYDGGMLGMDIYVGGSLEGANPCIIFSYGGGFKMNTQRSDVTRRFCRRLADSAGFVVAAIDYRLGLADFKSKGTLAVIKPLNNAIQDATEDLFKALTCILDNASTLHIDPAKIILCGSSAGAMMSLQADYELCNRTPMTALIPDDFRFAGVVAFAGALYSAHGSPKYTIHTPSPTFLLHGTDDKLVPYGRRSAIKYVFWGSSAIADHFAKNGYIYRIDRFNGFGHSVAASLEENRPAVVSFINEVVLGGRRMCVDQTITIFDKSVEQSKIDRYTTDDLYK